MAKKSQQPPDPDKRDTEQVRVDAKFLRRLRLVAEGLGMRPGEYIEKKLDPIIRNDFKAISLDFDEE